MTDKKPNLRTSLEEIKGSKLSDEDYLESERNLFGFVDVLFNVHRRINNEE